MENGYTGWNDTRLPPPEMGTLDDEEGSFIRQSHFDPLPPDAPWLGNAYLYRIDTVEVIVLRAWSYQGETV